MTPNRYIKTDIISDAVAKRIRDKGAVFASIDDAAEALVRIVSDTTLHGTLPFMSLAAVPSSIST
jgi:hypothetical protein